ncbi:P-loop containing nucleoside triphosphate hydrolase protein, partial [Exidia glandulosa HHB12029]
PVGSCVEFKRLDEYWDKEEYQWVQRESAPPPPPPMPKVDKWGQYCFTVVQILHEKTMQPTHTVQIVWGRRVPRVGTRVVTMRTVDSSFPKIDPDVFVRFFPLLEKHLASLKTSGSTDEQKIAQLQLLIDFLRSEYSSTFDALESATARSEITFALLGHILMPDTVLFSTTGSAGEPVAHRLTSAEQHVDSRGATYWLIRAVYIEATGSRSSNSPKFGWSSVSFSIPEFKATVKIYSLPVYPLRFNPQEAEITAKIIARGKRWASLDGIHHMQYGGIASDDRRVFVNSRIMIDRALYDSMSGGSPSVIRRDRYSYDYDSDDSDEEDHSPVSRKKPDPFPLLNDLTDEELLLTPITLYGFSLGDKMWMRFDIELVKDIKWNEEAFERLVLPPDQKDLIRGLVEAQAESSFEFDDYIEGKGRGLVINLFGPPGVGKTLSAEATSEHLKKPLYVVGAGDLGTRPSELDSSLTRIFKISATWGAVVLIDEADVFLEQRSLHDLQRNALVAVFLRQLEYFAGLLFITTNRVRSFDEAFQSRIHVSLRYRELEEDARRKVWRSFLDKVGLAKDGLSGAEEDELVKTPLNGRQIKNAVRTAGAVAASRKEKVAFSHLKSVVNIMQQFEQD